MDVAAPHLHDDGARALALLDDQGEYEPLLVHPDPGLQHLLVEDVEQGLSGEVGNEEGAGLPLAAEGACAEAALVVPAEDHPHVLHGDDLAARLAAHDLDGVLVAQVVAALDRVVGVVLPVVAPVGQGGVDPALRGVRVAPDRVDLRDNGNIRAVVCGSQRGSHAGQTGAYYEYVVINHLSKKGGTAKIAHAPNIGQADRLGHLNPPALSSHLYQRVPA